MRILYDTSVLIAALISGHPKHEICNHFLNQGMLGRHEIFIASHTLAESFAALTRLPVRPQIHPASARRMIKDNFLNRANVIELSKRDYEKAIDLAMEHMFIGGIIYDVLIYIAAKKVKAAKIATLNLKHFTRICQDEMDLLHSF